MPQNSDRQRAVQGRRDSEAERLAFMLDTMPRNKAYRYAADRAGADPDGRVLEAHRDRFRSYRLGWRGNPRRAIEEKLSHDAFRDRGFPPMCVDIETAAVCDLACPFCFRQYIATPDKIIRDDLYYRVIDQCSDLAVPSVKLNWRGEPIMHPRLPEFIDYAKRGGVLETIINTNAVTMDESLSRRLIESGLDLLIYSFDGGTKHTYEKMRVGRFAENCFETVYENIRRFARIRAELGSPLPRTKIQMILTEDTFHEQESFFRLFEDCVDDVSVKAYTERGGSLPDLDDETRQALGGAIAQFGLAHDAAYWRDLHGNIHIASGRLACEQPYQRLMVTYDGRVSMCCYDWGCEYPIGYVDDAAYEDGDRHYESVMDKARAGAKGFELMPQLKMPRRFSDPPHRVQTLREIWYGDVVNNVRRLHHDGRIEDVPICRRCPFKETYQWVKVELQRAPAAR